MKKITFILFLLTAVTFNSCSSDDGNRSTSEPITENLLIGKWKIESMTDQNGGDMEISDCATGVYSEFKPDGKYNDHYLCGTQTYVDNYNYTVQGNTIVKNLINQSEPGETQISTDVIDLTTTSLSTIYYYEDEDGNNKSTTTEYIKIP